jgi:glutaredoxin-like protein NrdH
MNATVYSLPACVQCNSTYKAFDRKGVSYSTVDVSVDADAHALTKELGYMQAPVVIVRDADGEVKDHWGGFNPEKITAFAQAVKAA